jgi:pyruvate dehydrogenase E1 component
MENEGSPTVILAKTVKGWTLGRNFEARNATHQIKKLTPEELKAFRDTLQIPIPDSEVADGQGASLHGDGANVNIVSNITGAGAGLPAARPRPSDASRRKRRPAATARSLGNFAETGSLLRTSCV